MELKIRLALLEDVDIIGEFYESVVDDLLININYPGWKKGVYPTKDDAILGIERKELYVSCYDNKIVGSVVINHDQDKNYQKANWQINVCDKDVYVIHTLAVHPQYRGLNIARSLLDFTEVLAKENNIKAIRLDVRQGNIPAIKLYLQCGYRYVDKITLDYEGFDLGIFELYEKNL